jgi:N-acetylmuramoyl-L-alanine amidase
MKLHTDAGHGGSDSGAVGDFREDDANLRVEARVAALAKAQGWTVERTRSRDVFVTLQERYADANAEHADVFVSIHHDWEKGEQAVIYANSNDSRETKSHRLADTINRRINDPKDGIPNGGIYADRRGLAVLKGTNMPAVIVEVARVIDDYEVERMAKAIVQGICDYKRLTYKAPTKKPMPLLRVGSAGGAVRTLQRELNEHGYKLAVDGHFGAHTAAAVASFQKKHKLTVDRIVGAKTWKALGH